MTQPFNYPVFAYARRFADSAFKAQSIALQGFEQIAGLQLAALEKQSGATSGFLAEAAETRSAEGLNGLLEKGFALNRDNAEQAITVADEIFSVTRKTASSLGDLFREQQAVVREAVASAAVSKKPSRQ